MTTHPDDMSVRLVITGPQGCGKSIFISTLKSWLEHEMPGFRVSDIKHTEGRQTEAMMFTLRMK